jgi:gas vesicle protein
MSLIKNVTTGAIIGAAAGMLIVPQLNRNTRKRLRRPGDMMMGIMGDVYDDLMDKIR